MGPLAILHQKEHSPEFIAVHFASPREPLTDKPPVDARTICGCGFVVPAQAELHPELCTTILLGKKNAAHSTASGDGGGNGDRTNHGGKQA